MTTVDDRAYRLPRTVVPHRYDLTLTPDLEAGTFSGAERVDVEVNEQVDRVVLNAIELEIHHAELVGDDGTRLSGTVVLDEDEERATFVLDGQAAPGAWQLELSFSGALNDKLHGFYRSRFTSDDGQERLIATTQFEATDARRAFPCWDEPDLKARFKVALVVDRALTAISNATVVSEAEAGDGKRRVEFAETIPMSTYLVAFVVGPFEATAPLDVDGVPLRVVCPPGRLALTDFALEIGAASLRFFAGYFAIPYPSDKLDLVAIPDFAFGAMENLGAVTFRETALLVDPATASRVELERVAQVVAHEIAHMWFGDLVTMKWWNGIWLNEAFATFMELLCVDEFRPQWQTWVGFGVSRAAAMTVDGLSSTRPVEFPVGRPEEAEGMFDVLTYQKGCGVLRMLEQYLGAEPFRRGIAQYLDTHAYGNTETADLWDSLEAASGEPARALMDSWILQGGYPLVSVSAEADGRSVTFAQRRFRYLDDGDESARWHVPVGVRASVGGEPVHRRLLLTGASTTVEFGAPVDWLVANDGGSGFYRVRYEPGLLEALTAGLHANLAPLERFNLASDTWASVLAGRSPLVDFVKLAAMLGDETDPDVWTMLVAPLRLLDKVVTDAERPILEGFTGDLVGPAFGRLGWHPGAGEDERTGQLRAILLGVLGTLGNDHPVQQRCRELHDAYLVDRSAVVPDLVDAVVGVVAETGDDADYERFLECFRHPATPQEEVRYLYGLGRFGDPRLIDRTLDMCLSDEVRTQNAPYLLAQMLAGRRSGPRAWSFVAGNWDTICRRFPDNSIPRMVEGLAGQASSALAGEARAFFVEHPVAQGMLLVEQTLERMHVNAAFAERERDEVGAALAMDRT